MEATNPSHTDLDDHTYTVHVEGNIPSNCNCPAWEYQDGSCKHMVAVAIFVPVLDAVTAEHGRKTGRGLMIELDEDNHSNERPDDCDCIKIGYLSRWPCYRGGFDKMNL